MPVSDLALENGQEATEAQLALMRISLASEHGARIPLSLLASRHLPPNPAALTEKLPLPHMVPTLFSIAF